MLLTKIWQPAPSLRSLLLSKRLYYKTASQNSHRTDDQRKTALENLKPKEIKPLDDTYCDIGESLAGNKIADIRSGMLDKLNEFYQYKPARDLAKTHNIDDQIFTKAFISFRRYCYKSKSLPPDLYVKVCDIIEGRAHVSDFFPHFLSHSREAFPHLECQEELKKISNLGLPHT